MKKQKKSHSKLAQKWHCNECKFLLISLCEKISWPRPWNTCLKMNATVSTIILTIAVACYIRERHLSLELFAYFCFVLFCFVCFWPALLTQGSPAPRKQTTRLPSFCLVIIREGDKASGGTSLGLLYHGEKANSPWAVDTQRVGSASQGLSASVQSNFILFAYPHF